MESVNRVDKSRAETTIQICSHASRTRAVEQLSAAIICYASLCLGNIYCSRELCCFTWNYKEPTPRNIRFEGNVYLMRIATTQNSCQLTVWRDKTRAKLGSRVSKDRRYSCWVDVFGATDKEIATFCRFLLVSSRLLMRRALCSR